MVTSPPSGPCAVLIVDDQEAFRAAARTVVAAARGFTVAAEAVSGEQAVELARQRPDLVLMDINLPGIDGLEATRRILAEWPAARVLLMSTYQVRDLPDDARTSGALAYVHKEDLSPAVIRDFAVGDYVGGF